MTLADVPLGMRLKAIAGWNQREADWRLLLEAGDGFVALVDGLPVGTATVVTYRTAGVSPAPRIADVSSALRTTDVSPAQHFSWIGMLLVDPAYRRRGVGTALLRAAIAHARPCGPIYLDATPQGEPLYASLGFKSVGSLVRMGRSYQLSVSSCQLSVVSSQVTAINEDMLAAVARFDAPVFGASREAVLHMLWRNAPQQAQCVIRERKLMGYCLGRSGSDTEQIGPLVADDVDTARALLLAALEAVTGHAAIIDVPVRQEAWRQLLTEIGFVERRPFTRMVLGEPATAGPPGKQFAIAGPEIG